MEDDLNVDGIGNFEQMVTKLSRVDSIVNTYGNPLMQIKEDGSFTLHEQNDKEKF